MPLPTTIASQTLLDAIAKKLKASRIDYESILAELGRVGWVDLTFINQSQPDALQHAINNTTQPDMEYYEY